MMVLRLRLLAGAWSPAAFLLAVRLGDDHPYWSIGLTVAGVLAVIGALMLVLARGTTNPQPYQLTRVTDQSSQIPGYLITFVFPFVFMDPSGWRDGLAWAMFAVLTAALVMKTDLVLVSPVLLLAGYRTYEVETSVGYAGTMLASSRPRPGQVIEAVQLSAGAVKATGVINQEA